MSYETFATYKGLTLGQIIDYYPRVGKPGRAVEIVDLRPHPLYGAIVRFRYVTKDPVVHEVSWGRFHTAAIPDDIDMAAGGDEQEVDRWIGTPEEAQRILDSEGGRMLNPTVRAQLAKAAGEKRP